MMIAPERRQAFAREVLGPILADFALRLWIALAAGERQADTKLLFCARGGLRLAMIYERFLAVSGLSSPVVYKPFMISRIAAVRAALVVGCASAYQQIGYELAGGSLADVVRALGGPFSLVGKLCTLEAVPYSEAGLREFLASDAGQPLWFRLHGQAALLREHLALCLEGSSRAVLCDSGLSGSTMQLMQDAVPDVSWSCLLFARANYKRLPTPHFGRTFGVSVQTDAYSPVELRSAILRHWHLLEALLEPDLESVVHFERVGGVPVSNLEVPGWEERVGPRQGEMFAGVLDYITGLPPGQAVVRVLDDVCPAYTRLRTTLTRPCIADAEMFDTGARSLDFGRAHEMTGQVCEPGLRQALRGSLWREGAVALAAPAVRRPVLAAIELLYTARWASRSLRAYRRS